MSDGADTASPVPVVGLFPVRLGDGDRQAPALLVVCDAAIRAIIAPDEEGQVIHRFACDRRVQPIGGLMVFHDLRDALSWFEHRLGARRAAGSLPMIWRESKTTTDEASASPAAERPARRRFVQAADAFCSSVQDFALPQETALRRMMAAWREWRLIAETRDDHKAAQSRPRPDRRTR